MALAVAAGRWQTCRRSSCDQLRTNGYLPGGAYLQRSSRSSHSGLSHRHSGAGRNPEPRRRPGVSVGRSVDSRFRGNDGMGGGNDGAGAAYPTVIPAQAGIQNPGEWRWRLRRALTALPPFILRPAQDERLPLRLADFQHIRHSGAGRNPEPRRRPGVSVGRGVDSRFRGNDGMGGGNDGIPGGLSHCHSGAGRNPEPRRWPGVSVGGGVDSCFRGNDGMRGGNDRAGAAYPTVIPAQAGIQNPGGGPAYR